MKKINIIIVICFIIFALYTFTNIKESNKTTMEVLITFSKTILPSLLPFLIINQLIIKTGIIDLLAYFIQYISYPLFKISGKGASVIIMGLLNGFPSSAIFTSLMLIDKQIDDKEAQRIVNCIFFPSISFLFAILNFKLNDNCLFIRLIICLYLSGFIFLYITSFKIKKEANYISFKETILSIKYKLNDFNLIKSIKETTMYSFNTLLNILGILIIFSIPCNIINKVLNNDYSYVLKGLIEFSIPSIQLSISQIGKKKIVLFLSTILSFSSISSIMQASLFINESNLNVKQFIFYRIIISILTTSLLTIFVFFL